MDEKHLIEKIAERTGVQKDEVRRLVINFKESVKEVVHAGGYVTLDDFGTFKAHEQGCADGTKPQAGDIGQPRDACAQPKERKGVDFYASREFKERLAIPFDEFMRGKLENAQAIRKKRADRSATRSTTRHGTSLSTKTTNHLRWWKRLFA